MDKQILDEDTGFFITIPVIPTINYKTGLLAIAFHFGDDVVILCANQKHPTSHPVLSTHER